jgi:hypothetical protein
MYSIPLYLVFSPSWQYSSMVFDTYSIHNHSKCSCALLNWRQSKLPCVI